MIVVFIIIAAFSVIGIVFSFMCKDDCDTPTPEAYIFATISVLSIVSAFVCKSTPTSMDVYRGKTTLEITYKEGVAIDSIVVFK